MYQFQFYMSKDFHNTPFFWTFPVLFILLCQISFLFTSCFGRFPYFSLPYVQFFLPSLPFLDIFLIFLFPMSNFFPFYYPFWTFSLFFPSLCPISSPFTSLFGYFSYVSLLYVQEIHKSLWTRS